MENYRIKIVEKNNGEKRYIPQVGFPRLKVGRFVFLSMSWENIIKAHDFSYYTATTMQASHDTEEAALDIIEKYKDYTDVINGNRTKSVTYKTVE